MNILIDTHILLWHLLDDSKLKKEKSCIITDPKNTIFLSIASIWELAVKISMGKLELSKEFITIIPDELKILNLIIPHFTELLNLPFYHKDPFDRIIISQAKYENYYIMSEDSNFKFYDVNLL